MGEHARDRRFDQLLVGHILDIIGANPFEDISEEFEHAIGIGFAFLGRVADRYDAAGDESKYNTTAN
jgi:hypothetical protein